MIEVIVTGDLNFYSSSAESIKSIIGDVGFIIDDDYIIIEGVYRFNIDLADMLKLTMKHQVSFDIVNGSIYLN